jgi:hypothetical protein
MDVHWFVAVEAVEEKSVWAGDISDGRHRFSSKSVFGPIKCGYGVG